MFDRPPGDGETRPVSTWRILLGAVVGIAVAWRVAGGSIEEDRIEGEVAARYHISRDEAHRLVGAMRESASALLADPRVRARVREQGAEAAERYGAELTARGLRRLTDGELLELAQLRRELADRSPTVCAGLWTGVIDRVALMRALSSLDDASVAAWFRLTSRAARLELDDAGAPRLADRDAVLDEGFARMFELVPEPQRAQLEARLHPRDESEAASCDAYRALGDGVGTLPVELRARFLRAQETGDAP